MVLLLRTAHYNLAKLRDVYLHTNTLAALANLAPHARDLSSHAAQRLVSLFDMLGRRYATVPFFPATCPLLPVRDMRPALAASAALHLCLQPAPCDAPVLQLTREC